MGTYYRIYVILFVFEIVINPLLQIGEGILVIDYKIEPELYIIEEEYTLQRALKNRKERRTYTIILLNNW